MQRSNQRRLRVEELEARNMPSWSWGMSTAAVMLPALPTHATEAMERIGLIHYRCPHASAARRHACATGNRRFDRTVVTALVKRIILHAAVERFCPCLTRGEE
jgi:hypothetical protein